MSYRCLAALLATIPCLSPSPAKSQTVEWPSYAHDVFGTKYSPLDQIDASNVDELEIVWRQPVIPDAIRDGDTSVGTSNSQNTPLMAGGLLYVSTGFGTVAALDPTTGDVVWNDDVPVFADAPQQRTRAPRGVAYWTDGDDARVIAARGPKLVALNPKTGERGAGFGDGGEVDLRDGLLRDYPGYNWNGAPLVVNDVIIVGSQVPDILNNQMPATKETPRGDVRGFDVRTGELLWTFHTIPLEDQFGVDTWGVEP